MWSEKGSLDLGRSLWWEESPSGHARGLRLVLRLAPELTERTFLAEVVARTDDERDQSFEVGKLALGPEGAETTEAALAQLDHLIKATEHAGPGTSLNAKAKGIRQAVENGREVQACQRLERFARQVQAQEGHSLTPEQATHFQADINTLPELLACGA